MLQNNYKKWRKGHRCQCGKEITTGSKTGLCGSCSNSKPKKVLLAKTCKFCNINFNTYPSRVNKTFCSFSCRINSQIGVKLPKERVQKSVNGHKGEKSHFWKGGITPINRLIRGSFEYKLWREAVFKRDDWRCIFCGNKSSKGNQVILNADHIKPFSLFPELRFAIDNGRTLCLDCHKKTDTYCGRIRNYKIT